MLEIGKMNDLVVVKENNSGYYLTIDEETDGPKELIFMPPSIGPEFVKIGDKIRGFVYLDSTGSVIATSVRPLALVGELACLEVKETQQFGAFLEWGITKDLLVPGNQQKRRIRKGDRIIVRVCLEEETGRIFGTAKIGKYLEGKETDFHEGQVVSIEPSEKGEIGYRCIIEKKHIGMLYLNEIFTPIKEGEKHQAVIKKIRPDGLIDLALQVQGFKNLVNSQDIILEALKGNGGRLELHDKSDPQKIKETLNMSKQTFKRTIGMLYKKRKIIIKDDSISLA